MVLFYCLKNTTLGRGFQTMSSPEKIIIPLVTGWELKSPTREKNNLFH